jgi:hypothetical protein
MPDEEGVLEIRPLYELDDFAGAVTPEIRERLERVQTAVDKRVG